MTEKKTKNNGNFDDVFWGFGGNVSIPLLNGKILTLEEWHKKYRNDVFEAYCMKKGKIDYCMIWGVEKISDMVFEKAYKIVYNNKNEDVFFGKPEILADENGKIISFMRRISEKEKDGLEGYEMIFNGSEWIFTHRMVCGNSDPSCVVHHIDGNKMNNSPNNLEVINKKAHASRHKSEKSDKETTPDLFGGFHVSVSDRPKKEYKFNATEVGISKTVIYENVSGEDCYRFKTSYDKNVALTSGVFVKIPW